ncbi:hypothetical protein J2W23_005883 [Variovorax boronicumulans]|uniref:hypothetical protein n=1 Tax=Variovorax boronicumulans TaxID=436515 RepID=UPI002788E9DA|nr:hypothetical protein [Variovorax boronicumulans]MDQ0017470.1 hypothetical protein [Variovorax boronicumulans]
MKPYITDALHDGRFVLPFQVEGLSADQIGKPFEAARVSAYGVPKSQTLEAAWLFRLILDSGWILDLSSSCTAVGGWQEIGSLNLGFAREGADATAIEWVVHPMDFRIASAERLIFEDAEVYAESGIALKDMTHGEIVVAAGVAPGSVSVLMPSSAGPLRSEFDIERLMRRPL